VKSLVKVKLIAYNKPIYGGGDPRKLAVLASKVSTGKLKEKNFEYYLSKEYPEDKTSQWIIAAAHGFPSVLEHIVFTFLIEDISRVTSHQLVRHRIASYTQESQRYSSCERDYIIPSTIKLSPEIRDKYEKLVKEAYELYEEMLCKNIPYEDARFILPQAVKTRILMTLNLRELIHIASLRLCSKAQWEIREVVEGMINEASKVIPELNVIKDELKKRCGSSLLGS